MPLVDHCRAGCGDPSVAVVHKGAQTVHRVPRALAALRAAIAQVDSLAVPIHRARGVVLGLDPLAVCVAIFQVLRESNRQGRGSRSQQQVLAREQHLNQLGPVDLSLRHNQLADGRARRQGTLRRQHVVCPDRILGLRKPGRVRGEARGAQLGAAQEERQQVCGVVLRPEAEGLVRLFLARILGQLVDEAAWREHVPVPRGCRSSRRGHDPSHVGNCEVLERCAEADLAGHGQ